MSHSLTIPLSRPIKTKLGEVHELVLREPTAGEILKSEVPLRDKVTPDAFRETQQALVSLVTGIALDSISELPISVLVKASEFLYRFQEAGLEVKRDSGLEILEIPLDPPIVTQSAEFTLLELREPTSGEVKRAESTLSRGRNPHSIREYQISIVSLASGAPRSIIEKLPISKLNEASHFLQGFITAGRETTSN